MRSSKTFTIILLAFLSICQLSYAHKTHSESKGPSISFNSSIDNILPRYREAIADIDVQYQGSMLGGHIVLSNGLIMHIRDYKTRDDNVMKKWAKGDLVNLTAHISKGGLVMSIRRLDEHDHEKVEPYVVLDVMNSPKTGLHVTDIRDKGEHVILSDGSAWEFSWLNRFSTEHWEIGEGIIVQGPVKEGDNSYEFINITAPVQKNVATAKGSFVCKAVSEKK